MVAPCCRHYNLATRFSITPRWLPPRFRRRPPFSPPRALQPYHGPAGYASSRIFFSRLERPTCLRPAVEPCCCTAWARKDNVFSMRFHRRPPHPSYRRLSRWPPPLPQPVKSKTVACPPSKKQQRRVSQTYTTRPARFWNISPARATFA
ncbi:hypothetical protein HPB52_020184 [Rhipicephalus sanguineus]|uniref:Uncharacterized protein n=1 Tax=Rhipicephalus sanguineus TaxID=34632 RepID=A0A9D4PMT4_RHISA|nr:hypothetical protein HPB52_020184 [Rhipicephalus sanguineus]